ncbi:hypothetical protein CEQ90_01330 [Lewinellaceae bacterium SD302]|nr:hypothetical protein CEQ90_01330 [Lewinellaceae bacterium SD302]
MSFTLTEQPFHGFVRETIPGEKLLESIRLIDGNCPLLAYHQERIDRSRKLLFPKSGQLKLKNILAELELPATGVYKLRLLYGEQLEESSIKAYEINVPRTIRLIDEPQIKYAKKYADRSALESCFDRRGECDDVLIIQHGFVTDTSYANVAFFDGNQWYTPSAPLLRGTRRAKLLREGTIRSAIIREKDIPLFKTVRLLNGMMNWAEAPVLEVERLVRI